jgi:mRNA-degrading endonuclease YafQ of YafQ-DinJ toxin-antitoxin module
MMMEVVWSSGFKRSCKKITKKNPQLKNQIINVLRLLADDPFTPSLKSDIGSASRSMSVVIII